MAIGWGVVGAGGIADRRMIPEGIVPSPLCRLAMVMDAVPERAEAVGRKYGVPHTTSLEELLANPQVQAVYIATPVSAHREQAIASARAGKHVLVEKPLALTLQEGREILAACQEAGVKCASGYMMRYHGAHQKAKQLIETGALGKVTFARAQLTCWYPPIPGAWRQSWALGGGGALMDLGTHCLELLEWLVGPVEALACLYGTLAMDYEVDDTATVLLRFRGGAQGVVDVSFCVPDQSSLNVLEVRGTRGALYARHTLGQEPGGELVAYIPGEVGGYDAAQAREGREVGQAVPFERINMYRAEAEAFVRAIEEGGEPEVSGEVGLRALELTLRAYEAARAGRFLGV